MLMRVLIASLAFALLSTPSWATTYRTDVAGGTGGGEYEISCPIASYLIGFNVRVGDWLDALEPVCGLIDFDNPGNATGNYRFKRVINAVEPRVTGGSGGSYSETSCADLNQVVTMIAVEVFHGDGHTYVSDIEPICRRMVSNSWGSAWRGHGVRRANPGNYEFARTFECPLGTWAVGIHGNSGSYIDSIGLVCDDAFRPGGVSHAPAPASPVVVPLPGKTTNQDPLLKALKTFGQQFPAPTINGTAVDVCLHWGTSCGAPAADEFCRRKGFTASAGNTIQNDAPPTLVLGDNVICKEPTCDRFSAISCK